MFYFSSVLPAPIASYNRGQTLQESKRHRLISPESRHLGTKVSVVAKPLHLELFAAEQTSMVNTRSQSY